MKKFLKRKSFKKVLGLSVSALTIIGCSTNEEQSQAVNSENQAFATPVSGNVYYIVNRNSGLYMDIENASNSAGANLQQFGSSASSEETHRQWEIIDVGSGYVRLKGIDSGKSLEVEEGSNSAGANVAQRAYSGETHQEWELIATNDGYFRIKGRDSGKSMAVENAGTSNGDNVEIAVWNGDAKFQWLFIDVNDDENNGGGLQPGVAPSENFDLTHWKITLSSGAEVYEDVLSDGYIFEDQFFTADDGGMVFKNYPGGPETGTTVSSTYSRVELREMMRENDSIEDTGINKNNWVLSSSSEESIEAAAAVGGTLEATLVINHVTTTTDDISLEDYETEFEYLREKGTQNGRITIGQIHASDNEPCRLYYHKQPEHTKGALYFAYDPNVGDQQYFNLFGNFTNGSGWYDIENAVEPENGIEIGQEFSYKIDVQDTTLIVTIYDADKNVLTSQTVDMSAGGFEDDYMYFKAGVYSGNKYVGNETDYEEVTFYSLEVTH